MTRQAIWTLVIASIVTAGSAGCQSASRWAWWNRDDGTSSVAQSAAPTLPSESATPHAVEVPGLEPASSPSAANLAAAQTPTNAPNPSLPASSAATLANAPLANYPMTLTTPGSNPAVSGTSPVSQPTTPAAAIASVPPSGPYDPNGYKSSEPLYAATSRQFQPAVENPLRTATASDDRYAVPSASNSAAQVDPAYPEFTNAPSTAATSEPLADRYALPTVAANNSQETGSSNSVAALNKSAPEAAFASSPAPAASQPTAGTNAIAVTPVTTAAVQISTPVGKYRPGGTSDYTGAGASQHIELAALPAAAKPVSPAGTNGPSSAPAATPAASSGIGTY
ncbi:MAG TPA: hypothetical protein VJ828_07010 [Lacipirellulaceae bacterium]|nr:hypothetical protein [Lacipirellulaceae bacterium]